MNMSYLQEAFKAMSLLEGEDFSLDNIGVKDILDFKDHDELNDIIDVYDPEAETEEELNDSYIGSVILECEVCHSPIFKKVEDVVVDENSDLANIEDECPICHSNDGFKIIGQVAPYQEEPELKVEIEDKSECEGDECNEEELEDEFNEAYEDCDEKEEKEEERKGFKKVEKSAIDRSSLDEELDPELEEKLDEIEEKIEEVVEQVCPECEENDVEEETIDAETEELQAEDELEEVEEGLGGAILGGAVGAAVGHPFVGAAIGNTVGNVASAALDNKNEALTEANDEDDDMDLYNAITKELYSASSGNFGTEKQWADYEAGKAKRKPKPLHQLKPGKGEARYDGYSIIPGPNDEIVVCADKEKKLAFAKRVAEHFGVPYRFEVVKDYERGSNLPFHLVIDWAAKNESIEEANEPLRKFRVQADIDRKGRTIHLEKTYQAKDAVDAKNKMSKFVSRKYGFGTDEFLTTELKEDLENTEDIEAEVVQDTTPNNARKESDDFKKESDEEALQEGFEKIDLEMEDKVIHVSEEEKEPIPDAEMIAPVSDELESELMNPVEDIAEPEEAAPVLDVSDEEAPIEDEMSEDEILADDEDIDYDIDEFDEEDFDDLGESYLKKVYENVEAFKTSSAALKDNKLVIEGVIKFNSGKEKVTQFIFEAQDATKSGKVRFIGENAQISRGKKSFTLAGKMEGTKFIAESLNYNYRVKDAEGNPTKLYGTIKK